MFQLGDDNFEKFYRVVNRLKKVERDYREKNQKTISVVKMRENDSLCFNAGREDTKGPRYQRQLVDVNKTLGKIAHWM